MGCSSSSEADNSVPPVTKAAPAVASLKRAKSEYTNTSELEDALNKGSVLEDINIMLFVDFTASNKWTGKNSFNGKGLHDLNGNTNHYLDTIESLRRFSKADQDGHMAVYTYGSGAAGKCSGHVEYHGIHKSVDDVKKWYTEHSQKDSVQNDMAGPTTLKYVLDEAHRVTQETGRYHIVVVITDGDPTDNFKATDIAEVYEATRDPLSIVVIGVGDGEYNKETDLPEFPFYEGLDDGDESKMGVPPGTIQEAVRRKGAPKFDNLQFINLEKDILRGAEMSDELHERFFLKAFAEVPRQYELIKEKLRYHPQYGSFSHPAPHDWVDPNPKQDEVSVPVQVATA